MKWISILKVASVLICVTFSCIIPMICNLLFPIEATLSMMAPANPTERDAAGLSPEETARYTAELLDSLRKIALKQGQALLAHLLELAAFEAKALGKDQVQETRLPE
jgi:hypothetical protein